MSRKELIVDSFAGGGGASLGIQLATGRSPDIAINHDAAAIAVHAANHPETRHCTEDVWKVRPLEVTGGKPVALLWASPDCKHFSRAKGSKPVNKTIRSLAWVVVQWALQARPRIIILENVREFEDWGPTLPAWRCRGCGWRGTEGQAVLSHREGRQRCPRCNSLRLRVTEDQIPDPAKKGITFRRFTGRLRGLGYVVQWKTLDAADYGAPTRRKRLFLVARRDGAPIEWPEPTHASPAKVAEPSLFGSLQPWRTAAECIDWSRPCPSIFERKRPLADATMRRIALGIKRYVLDCKKPFIVRLAHGGNGRWGSGCEDPDQPQPTMTGSNEYAVVQPFVSTYYGANKPSNEFRGAPVEEPLRTQGTENRFAVVQPYMIGAGGPANAGVPRAVDEPAGTIMPKNNRAVVTPFLSRLCQEGGNGGYVNNAEEPLTTVVSKAEHLVIAPTLVQTGYGERDGQAPRALDLGAPLGTTVSGQKHALVSAFIAKHFGGVVGVPAEQPLPTTTERGTQNQLAVANLVRFNHDDAGIPIDTPAPTVTSNNHAALVYSFLTKYFGTAIGTPCDAPLATTTGKDRFGLVTVEIAGESYVIVDIGMRMLTPRELARCQGFPDDYRLPGDQLPGSKTTAVRLIGNSVCPQVAEAIVRANVLTPVPA